MGTPDFAVPCLKALMEADEQVVSVYTQPDRPKGRGRKMTPPPVKEWALLHHLPVFQPARIREAEVIAQLAEQKPDLLIVVAYGLILPQTVLDIPAWGAINVHASLLPKYRGAAPIQWALINGEKESGITTMKLDAGMDTGDILLQETEEIQASDTGQSLHDRLSHLGGKVLLQTLAALRQGTLVSRPQDPSRATYAQPLKKEQGEIRWERSALEIDRWIRGLSPWPGAFTFLKGKRIIIHQSIPDPQGSPGTPGTIYSLDSGLIRIHTAQGLLSLTEVQLEGHKRMSASELIRGFSFQVGQRLGRV